MRQLVATLGTTLVVLLLASWLLGIALAALGLPRATAPFWLYPLAMIGVYGALRLATRGRLPRI